MQITPYLHFAGQCEQAFRFYAACLEGAIVAMLTHEGTPAAAQVPAEWRSKIMHARLVAGDAVLMGSDCPPDLYRQPGGIAVSIQVNDPARGERIFRALQEGGQVIMPFQPTFWAAGFGMLTDRFGIPWMINCEKAG